MSQTSPSTDDRAVSSPRGEGALWLALRFPEAWFESRCPEAGRAEAPPAALTGRRQAVVAVNAAAARLGVRLGETRLAAESRFHDAAPPGTPALRFLEPDARAVAGWLEQLGETALQYTSRLHLPRVEAAPGLLLEVGRSAAVFGGLDRLVGEVLRTFREEAGWVNSALAPHPRVAWALARMPAGASSPRRPDSAVLERSRQVEAVCRLPLSALDWPADPVARFGEMGVSTLGQLRRLPRDGVAMRAASALLDDVDRLFAERDWSLPAFTPPERFEREIDLWDPASGVERLLLLSRGLLVALASFLQRRQRVLAAFEMSFVHESAPPTGLVVRTADLGRDERVWMEQLRLSLQARELPPVHRIRVYADRFTRPSSGQRALFAEMDERENDERRLRHRLQARLGEGAVGRLTRAPAIEPPRQSRSVGPGERSVEVELPSARPGRPFWWLESPVPRSADIRGWGEIERIRTGWWAAETETADYRPATLADGRAVWLRREAESRHGEGGWEVIGLE